MKTLTISGTERKTIGRTSARVLRRTGKVPCVLYGGKNVLHFEAAEKDFKHLVYTPDIHMIKLDVGGKQTDAIFKDIQFHPVTDKIMHVDFLEIIADKPVVMDVPVKLTGSSVGVKEGGKLLKKLSRIRVKAPISKIPGNIDLNIEPMKIGDYIRIKDLKYEDVTFLHEPSVTIVAVKVTREVVEEPAAGAAAPTATVAGAPASAAGTPAAPAAAAPASAKEGKKEEKKK